jgi:hypothetical protein
MTERRKIDGWEVCVSINGENVLTIGHNHLSGIENIDDYGDEVRNCAEHLLSFIGRPERRYDPCHCIMRGREDLMPRCPFTNDCKPKAVRANGEVVEDKS